MSPSFEMVVGLRQDDEISTLLLNMCMEKVTRNVKTNPERTIFNVNKSPTDATVCRYLFTAKLLYMFRVSQHPSSGVLKTVPAASGTGHTTCTATPLQHGLIGTMERSSGTSSMTCTGGCGYSF